MAKPLLEILSSQSRRIWASLNQNASQTLKAWAVLLPVVATFFFVPVMAYVQDERLVRSDETQWKYDLALIALLPILLSGVFLELRRQIRKAPVDVALSLVGIAFAAYFLFLGVFLLINFSFDRSLQEERLKIVDDFYIRYERRDGGGARDSRYIALKNTDATRPVELRELPMGLIDNPSLIDTNVLVLEHKGDLNLPWREIRMGRINLGRASENAALSPTIRYGSAVSAGGSFSAASPYLKILQSWNIPVEIKK